MTADEALVGAVRDLSGALADLGAPAMIIGGIAVIARGIPRQTVDVDAAVWAEHLDLDRLLDTLARHHIVPRVPEAKRFALERQVVLARHEPTGTPLEISLAWLPFEREALDRATPVEFGGIVVPVATAEDLVIYKAVAWRDRDRADIERLVVRHGRTMDLARVRRIVQELSNALDEPERVPAFEALIHRALGPG